ncbi:hypothetical protein APA_3060 [Pseudanabaena sp. lw0831]|nr:hypothetical protein APA_3060 [Pseudanabaena sp. lw0831]
MLSVDYQAFLVRSPQLFAQILLSFIFRLTNYVQQLREQAIVYSAHQRSWID